MVVMDVVVPVSSFGSMPLINGLADAAEHIENSVIGGFTTKDSNSFVVSNLKNANHYDAHIANKDAAGGVETASRCGEPCFITSSCLGDAPEPLAVDSGTSKLFDTSPKALADLSCHSTSVEMIFMHVQGEASPPIKEIGRNVQDFNDEGEDKDLEYLPATKCDEPCHIISVCVNDAIQPLAVDVVVSKPLDNSSEALAGTNVVQHREPSTIFEVKDQSHHPTNRVIFTAVQAEAFPGSPPNKHISSNAKDLNNGRDENKEQECLPGSLEPIKVRAQQIKKASRSLRALLSSEHAFLGDGDEQGGSPNITDGRSDNGMDICAVKRSPATKMSSSGNELPPHFFTERWYDHLDKEEYAMGAFSGPIGFSGPIISTGAGPFPHSGSISHRSDSSTSTRSFAFPILASEWNTSPVTMGQPSSHYFRRRRKSRFCSCCRRPSTSFD